MKQIIYTISLIFLLSACTDEQYTNTLSSGGGDPVLVKLTLNTQPMQSPLSLNTKGSSNVVSSTQVCKGMEISLVETPVTRATFEDEIKNFWVLQFTGTTPESTLCRKQFINGSSVKDVELLNLQTNAKSRIIVIANVAESTFAGLTIDGTTLDQFDDMGIPDSNTDYPLFHDPSAGESRIIFSGSTDMIVTTNKQADIMLYRAIARVKVNLSLSSKMQEKGYTTWSCQLMHIPKKSFYFSTDRIAIFPDASVGYKDYAPQSGSQPPTIDVYLPVNLQNSVPFTTPEKRRVNAPADATYLQVMGLQMAGSVITKSVIYQIHLGSNFTNNYSISSNVSYTYNITITGESEDDSRVVKFIPGYFGGPLKMYKEDGTETTNSGEADIWRYEKRIEVYISDVNPAGGIVWKQSGTMPSQLNDLMDGRKNTWNLKLAGSATKYPAVQKCIDLNGTSPATMEAMEWYMPSYGQSLGIYVAGSNTLKTLPNTTYWSSTANGTYVWGTKIWSGQSAQESPGALYSLRCVKDLDPKNTTQ